MEGWVQVKIGGFLLNSLQKCYAVLENQQLMYYAGLDPVDHKPTGIVGTLHLHCGKVTRKKEKLFSGEERFWVLFSTCGQKKQSLAIDTMIASAWTTWGSVSERAVGMHVLEEKELKKFNGWRKALGFEVVPDGASEEEQREGLSKAKITRAYKVRAIKAHPDRGGHPDEFSRVSTASTELLAWQAWRDEKDTCEPVEYEAAVEKGSKGLGIAVAWDQVRQHVCVSTVQPAVVVKALTDGAGGSICPGDVLIAIDDDDCSDWRISRMTARLSAARVTPGSVVHFTFLRWKKVPVQEVTDDESYTWSPATSAVSSPVPSCPTHDPWDNSYQNNINDSEDRVSVGAAAAAATVAAQKEFSAHRQTPSAESKGAKHSPAKAAAAAPAPEGPKRRLSVGVTSAPVDSVSFVNDRISELCHQKAELHGTVAELESSQMQLRDRVHQLMEMLAVRRESAAAAASASSGSIEGVEEELEIIARELELAQQNLILKKSENRQLAAHVSALRHSLNRPLVDAVEQIRRAASGGGGVLDETTLTNTRSRASAYQDSRRLAQEAVDALLDLL